MSTERQQLEYFRLSGVLQSIGLRYKSELPNGTASLSLTNDGGKVVVTAYSNDGKLLGSIPNTSSSDWLRKELNDGFLNVELPDTIVTIIV